MAGHVVPLAPLLSLVPAESPGPAQRSSSSSPLATGPSHTSRGRSSASLALAISTEAGRAVSASPRVVMLVSIEKLN